MKLKKGSKAAKDFMSKIRAKKGAKGAIVNKKKENLEKLQKGNKGAKGATKGKIKKASVLGNVLIFEYIVSYDGKYYVSSNMELRGFRIKKVGTGQDHKRGLKTYIMSQAALKKMQNLFGKENTKYIQTDY